MAVGRTATHNYREEMELRELLEARSARALDEDGDGTVLVTSDLTGVFQLYELDDELRQLTDFDEPVSGRFVPGTRTVIVQMDAGGNERHQLFLLDRDDPPLSERAKLEPLTSDEGSVHSLLGVRPDGSGIAFASNRRNGIDFDVFLLDLASREISCVYDGGGWVSPGTGFSPSGRYLSFLLPGPRPLDSDLVLADLAAGRLLRPLAHHDEAALVGGPSFVSEHSFIAPSNVGHDFAALVWHDLESGKTETLLESSCDLDCVASRDGATLLVVRNDGGGSSAELYSLEEGMPPVLVSAGALPLPGGGVIDHSLLTPRPLVGPRGLHVTYSFTSPTVPGDIWRVEGSVRAARRLTTSPGPPADELVSPTTDSVTSFDGETVPVFVYRPAAPGPHPVVIVIHGGPESQSMLTFNAIVQGLVSRGFGVVVPNVRGSTGYGKRYASLDDRRKRLDSVRDLAALHSWLGKAGFDPDRAALYGGSYGGYMVLAGVAFQPELWAAGVDIVGISDLVTFLENTAGYRRSQREREYGSLAEDRPFLEEASPLRRADDIVAPLFVIHGANDPRVPVSEAHQLVASLAARSIPHELVVFEDEGHGLSKLANRLAAYPKALDFLERHLITG